MLQWRVSIAVSDQYLLPSRTIRQFADELRSWQNAYTALSQLDNEINSGNLKKFLLDPETTNLLVRIFSPYGVPNGQTRSTFDTKTSAINVAPSAHGQYDINNIKADALWLSEKVTIDEVAALRFAVLEWQTRSASRLLQNETLNSPAKTGQNSVHAGLSSTLRDSIWQSDKFSDAQGAFGPRRLRLLEIYLSERQYLFKSSEYILSHLVSRIETATRHTPARHQDSEKSWLDDIGQIILATWKIDSEQDGKGKQKSFVTLAVDALRSRLQGITHGCPWFQAEAVPDTMQVAWAHNQSLEAIHVLQIAMSVLQVHKGVFTSGPLLSWFRFMSEVDFFEGLRQPVEDAQGSYDLPLQSLAVLVSLALVDISGTLELLTQTSTSLVPSADPTDISPYTHNPATINELNDIIINFAPLRVASPVTLAWSIITQSIREMALATRESKETRQSLRAADRYGATDSSDTDGPDRYSLRTVSTLRRRSSTGSDTSLQSLLVEDLYDAIAVTSVDGDTITYLALHAVHNDNVFDILSGIASEYCTSYGFEHSGKPGQNLRYILLELIQCCVDFIQYQPALIDSSMAILTGNESFWDLLARPASGYIDQPSNFFIRDYALRQKLLLVAASRFPYESVPFLQLCRALAFQYTDSDGSESAPWTNLEELDTFTCRLPSGFEATSPIREEEDGDFIRLTDSLSVLVGSGETDLLGPVLLTDRPSQTIAKADLATAEFVVPAGTTGVIQSETKPFVIGWNHQYPGLAYMGRILRRASATGLSAGSSFMPISPMVVAEVIRLINVLLLSAMKNPSTERDPLLVVESAQAILCHASDGLDRNQDVISVIFDIFDDELHQARQEAQGGNSLDVLVQCVKFTYATLLLMPDRVWPFLTRSGLLRIEQDECQLNGVISQEMIMGQYDFLLGCIRLYEALIEDAVSHGVSRKVSTKAIARFGRADNPGSGVSHITMQNVLFSFTRSMIDVMESAGTWRFVVPAERMEINQRICSTFGRILNYCYGVNDNDDISQKLTHSLATVAKYLVETFLSASNNDSIVRPLLEIFSTAVRTQKTSLPTKKERYHTGQSIAALNLASMLLRINTALHRPSSYLEGQLFGATPLLVQAYAVQEIFRRPVVDLFNALLSSSSPGNQQPPSLLGHLGHKGANDFLDLLSQLDKPIDDSDLSISIWKMFSAVVSKRQQWFAMYVLTGNTPRETLNSKNGPLRNESDKGDPLLSTALSNLSCIEKLDPSLALGMLEFVALSADYWPWVFATMENHPNFLKAVSEYLAQIGQIANHTSGRSSKSAPDHNSLQIAAYITKILAMHTHSTRQSNEEKTARNLIPHLNYLVKNAITAPTYNNSLHSNLCSNLESKFPGCSLADFKKTQWRQTVLGDAYFYDVEFASKVLSHNTAWAGRKGQGFMDEFRRANANLSLVEAQVVSLNLYSSMSANVEIRLGSFPWVEISAH